MEHNGIRIQLLGNSIILTAIIVNILTAGVGKYEIFVILIALIGIITTLIGFFKKSKKE